MRYSETVIPTQWVCVTTSKNKVDLVKRAPIGAFFISAPGRAHLLGGESPLLAVQGEELAERQGCRG